MWNTTWFMSKKCTLYIEYRVDEPGVDSAYIKSVQDFLSCNSEACQFHPCYYSNWHELLCILWYINCVASWSLFHRQEILTLRNLDCVDILAQEVTTIQRYIKSKSSSISTWGTKEQAFTDQFACEFHTFLLRISENL